MTADPPAADGSGDPLVRIVSTAASAARVYDYLMGGDDNFAVDRATAEQIAQDVGGMDNVRAGLLAQRAFQDAALRLLAGERGLRQFLDIGSGIPSSGGLPAVVQEVAPEARIVYVDNDPLVLAHAHALPKATLRGAAAFVDADLRDAERIVRQAATTLDLAQPIAVVLVGVLHTIPDGDDPWGIVARLMDRLAPGSHLVVSHATGEIQADEMARLARDVNEVAPGGLTLRGRDEVARFFAGLELLEPGLVPADEWLRWHGLRSSATDPHGWQPPYHVGIGHRP
jgi:hypothetical protein